MHIVYGEINIVQFVVITFEVFLNVMTLLQISSVIVVLFRVVHTKRLLGVNTKGICMIILTNELIRMKISAPCIALRSPIV